MKLFKNYAAVASLALLATLAYTGNALAGPGTVGLGTATSFAVLAHTGVTDTPGTPSTINGDLGNDQNIPTTGNPTLNGTSHINDGVAAGARAALNTAYGDAAGRTPSTTLVGLAVPGDNQLGGRTLVAGVYNFASATTANLTGVLTLSGSSSDVWIFQAGSDLVTATGSSVNFIGGASPCNVYWQVPTSATLNGQSFAGTVMANASVTFGLGVTLNGRALAYNGDVTLIGDTINASGCAAAPAPPPAPTPPPAPVAPPAPAREIYCDPVTGQTYDLVQGQDKQAPYAQLGLVLAAVDPVTGAKSCSRTAPTPVATPVPTPVPLPPTPVKPTTTPKPVVPRTVKAVVPRTVKAIAAPKVAASANAAAAAKLAKAKAKAAAAKRAAAVKASSASSSSTATHARPARKHVGLTG